MRVVGLRGGGKSALVSRVMEGLHGARHVCPPLPDTDQRLALFEVLDGALGAEDHGRREPPNAVGEGGPPEWTALFERLDRNTASGGSPFVLVLDDAHRLVEARAPFIDPLVKVLTRPRAGPPLHVVLVGPAGAMPGADDLGEVVSDTIHVIPLPFRAAAPLLPGTRPLDKLTAYGIFGGMPSVLAALDTGVTAGTNLRRLVLDQSGSLAEAGAVWLERDLQAPARYYAILKALSWGEADWAAVHRALPDLTRSGQVAPYLARLSELGLLVAHRSLDAPPRSRSTRYAIADPFLAFWFRYVLPFRTGRSGSAAEYFTRAIRPSLDDHMKRVFPLVCRQHMRFDAIETLGANARESGGLWGPQHDLPVAGLLRSGAAFYGDCSWMPTTSGADASPLERIARAKRETRYGFGRQTRLSLVFTGYQAPAWLRRDVARHAEARLIDAEALAGM